MADSVMTMMNNCCNPSEDLRQCPVCGTRYPTRPRFFTRLELLGLLGRARALLQRTDRPNRYPGMSPNQEAKVVEWEQLDTDIADALGPETG